MLAPEITNHVPTSISQMLEQYKHLQLFTALIAAIAEQVQELENATFPLNEGRQLFNGTTYPAVGAQLDGIGALVGVARNGLGDAEYLIFILGTIAENNSDTTRPTMTNIINIFFAPAQLNVFDHFPAEFDVQVADSALDPSLYLVVAQIIQASLGAGIKLGFISTISNTTAFKYGSVFPIPPLVGSAGYGDANAPGPGGEYAGVIYNNAAD